MAQTQVGIRELLEAGVHFGHQTRRWNPKMRRFIHGEREGIYLIDLLKTEQLLHQAQAFAAEVARRGGTVLFVGTKKQARDAVKEAAEACGMPYVNHRWLGGLLTNFQTISLRIKRLHDLERYAAEGQLQLLPTRERLAAEADLEKLQANLGGVKHMQRPPDAVFVIDLKTEEIAVREAQRLRIPIIGLVDTNCDPDGITYVVPGNDDAMKACRVIAEAIGNVVQENRSAWQAAEEERLRHEAEERARQEAEEQARKEAEAAAAAEAEAAAAAAAAAPAAAGTGAPAQADPDLVHTESPTRNEAEAEVARAVEAKGRPQPDGPQAEEVAAAAQAADEPAMPAAGSPGPPARQKHNPNDGGDRIPQAAGAAGGAGSAASDTAEPAAKPKRAPRKKKAAAPAEAAPAAETPAEPKAPAEPETPAADAGGEDSGGVVEVAQGAVASVADTAAGALETVEEAAPGPLKAVAKAARRGAKKVAEVASPDDSDDSKDDTKTDG